MIKIQIWGDLGCPFSYLQTIVLLKLKAKYKDQIDVSWRAFEINLSIGHVAPSEEYLEKLKLASEELIAQEVHLQFLSPKILPNLRLAQESIYFAESEGRSLDMAIALFGDFFKKESDIGDEKQILKIAARIGLDSKKLEQTLKESIFTKTVSNDENEFKIQGFQGVPAMLIGEKDFSPRSFMPLVGFRAFDELDPIIAKLCIDKTI